MNEIATLTGIPQRSCRLLIRALPHHVTAAEDGPDVKLDGKGSNLEVDGDAQEPDATAVGG